MASLRGEAACTDRSVGWGWLRLSTSPRGETLFGSSQCPKSSNIRSEGCLAWLVPGVVPCTNATCRDLIQMRPSGSAGWPQAASAAGALWGCGPCCVRCPRPRATAQPIAALRGHGRHFCPTSAQAGRSTWGKSTRGAASVCREKGSEFCPGKHDKPAEPGFNVTRQT